jgi:single-strand DNA-binding protein
MNIVTLVGTVEKIEIRATQSGSEVANMTVKTTKSWNDRQSGERKTFSGYHKVTSFFKDAVAAAKNLREGDLVGVAGELNNRSWTKQDGTKAYTTEVAANVISPYAETNPTQGMFPPEQKDQWGGDVQEDSIPF